MANENSDIFILVGLHKTGCTFIQEEIMKKIPNSFYTESWGDIWGEKGEIPREGNVSIANPNLSSVPFAPKVYPFPLREGYARDLAKLYPNANVLVGFRDKKGWLRRLYSQRLRGGKDITKNFIEFDDFKKELSYHWFMNAGYVTLLKSLFPRVFVYDYETLCVNPELFVKNISDFIGVAPVGWKNVVWKKGLSDDEVNAKRPVKVKE